MNNLPLDQEARVRFCTEWQRNFAVSANAGSGKTTAISERLATMALSEAGSAVLSKTAVVTFTKKAALQIGQRARSVLLKRLSVEKQADLAPLDRLERTFFGTIHSFCLLLAQRYGQALGINLNPAVITDADDVCWEEFLEQDVMQFTVLTPPQVDAFLRHVPLETIFELTRQLDRTTASRLLARRPRGLPPAPDEHVLAQILALAGKGVGKKNLEISQQAAREWLRRFREERGFLKPFEPAGSSKPLVVLADEWMAPLKSWLAEAGAALAAELAGRYREYRFERGVQTYADQVDAALAVLQDLPTLEKIRADGWRVILDEAQDTDPQQFAVLVEIARPVGVELDTWPQGGGAPPREGHFCMVGDGQQAIYGSRADIRNFLRHVQAFARGDGGELLEFQVTFRAPETVIELLNQGLPAAFGGEREHNLGLPPAEGAPSPVLQVPYVPLQPAPGNAGGRASCFVLNVPAAAPANVAGWLAEEARQLAEFLKSHGPVAVGADKWGDVCVLAPRNDWLVAVRKAFEAAGLKVALQMRKNRNGDNPAYAWITGLLAVVCDPDNAFEWFGVLREVFGVSDALLAQELRDRGAFQWDEPEVHPEPLRGALQSIRPWVLRANDEGVTLEAFATGLVEACLLPQKARVLDPSGTLNGEIERLLAEAAILGLEGAGPREWLRELLARIEEGRPAGKPEADAVNLLTAHSSKGLEWPVIVPVGLWRRIGKRTESGLKLIAAGEGEPRVYFDSASLPGDAKEAREREHWRELVRLLYVALTRARHHLVLPWSEDFGGLQRSGKSFAELWGDVAAWRRLPVLSGERLAGIETLLPAKSRKTISKRTVPPEVKAVQPGMPGPALPVRLLPHQLAKKPDLVRSSRHEMSAEDILPVRDGDEAIEYGLWWHETMEFMPWASASDAIDAYCKRGLVVAAEKGFGLRAEQELAGLRQSAAWRTIHDERWTRLAELSVFAPLRPDAWIDGVIDLVLKDAGGQEVRVLDWKTNRKLAGESDTAILERLKHEYIPQLAAYGSSVRAFFPGASVTLWIYSSAAGDWVELRGT